MKRDIMSIFLDKVYKQPKAAQVDLITVGKQLLK